MQPIGWISVVALSGGVAGLLWLAASASMASDRQARINLHRGMPQADATVTTARSRGKLGRRVLPPRVLGWLDTLLDGAGRPAGWPLDRLVTVKLLLGLIGLALGLLLVVGHRSQVLVALGFTAPFLGFFLPDLLLYNAGTKRRETIRLQLPDILDQMSVAVDAGLGFDAALVRVARTSKGALADELVRTLQDIQLGQPRRQAYEMLARRCRVPSLRRFMRAVIQAEEYGIALSVVLNTQAKEMRTARRQFAEQQAMKIPVKVVFPMALCILPVLFLVLLGPAVISIMQAFSR